MLKKPTQIYAPEPERHFSIVSYGRYELKHGVFEMPEIFSNFSAPLHKDAKPDDYVGEEWDIFKTDSEFETIPGHLYYLHYCEFASPDELVDFENLIMEFENPEKKADITWDQFEYLASTLMKFRPVKVV